MSSKLRKHVISEKDCLHLGISTIFGQFWIFNFYKNSNSAIYLHKIMQNCHFTFLVMSKIRIWAKLNFCPLIKSNIVKDSLKLKHCIRESVKEKKKLCKKVLVTSDFSGFSSRNFSLLARSSSVMSYTLEKAPI